MFIEIGSAIAEEAVNFLFSSTKSSVFLLLLNIIHCNFTRCNARVGFNISYQPVRFGGVRSFVMGFGYVFLQAATVTDDPPGAGTVVSAALGDGVDAPTAMVATL